MPEFVVTVRRSTYAYQSITVDAEDKWKAMSKAESELEDDSKWDTSNPDDVEIEAMQEVTDTEGNEA